ncbi:MAG: potassium channel family protein [Culicoidibacterales bacterium]
MALYIEQKKHLSKWQQQLLNIFALNTIYSFFLLLFGTYFSSQLIQAQEYVILVIFILEYIFRIVLSQRKFRYICSVYGVIDLLACFPLIAPIFQTLHFLNLFQGLQVIASLRVLKFIRLIQAVKTNNAHVNKNNRLIVEAIKAEQELLLQIAGIIISLAITGALIVYALESPVQPEQFSNIFDAFWWAFITFTTVGYGDIYPITMLGRIVAMGLSVLGIAMFAIPTTVISSSLINRFNNKHEHTPKHQTFTEQLAELEQLKCTATITTQEYEMLRQRLIDSYGKTESK